MGNADADDNVSIVIRKDGEHFSSGEHNGYVESVYKHEEVPLHGFNSNLKDARAKARVWAIENYFGKDFLLPNGEGVYSISKGAIDKYLNKTSIDNSENAKVHLSAQKKLPEIISSSVEGEIHADYIKEDEKGRFQENGIKD